VPQRSVSLAYILGALCVFESALQTIALVFECYVLCISCCVARQHDKNCQFSWLGNITGSKRRLDRPFLWPSVKLFIQTSAMQPPQQLAMFQLKRNRLYLNSSYIRRYICNSDHKNVCFKPISGGLLLDSTWSHYFTLLCGPQLLVILLFATSLD